MRLKVKGVRSYSSGKWRGFGIRWAYDEALGDYTLMIRLWNRAYWLDLERDE